MTESLVEIEFSYSHSMFKNVLSQKELEMLQSVCSRPVRWTRLTKRHIDKDTVNFWNDEDKQHPDSEILLDKYYVGGNTNIFPLNHLMSLGLNIEFKVSSKIKEYPEYDVQETILHKLLSLESKLAHFDQGLQFNQKVGVHISDLGLLSVKEVTWLEDACTEELQRQLDEGWRILAICPQQDSRRPDYVLGRNSK